MLRFALSLLIACLGGVAAAEPVVGERAVELGEIAFQQALKDLSNDLRLLCVAAHPDDEDGATLAYHRYKYGIETHVLICTRGEGGQNEIGPELYEDLAVIRTKEMQAAADIEGAQLHFLDMPEFGYSKTLEETLEVWGEEELLRRMVRKIREIRPHVIITHHGRMKDHGHHQAVGWALKKAFDLAADAGAFPDTGEPWQPSRLFIRDFYGGVKTAEIIDISEIEPLRGKTYAEMHADSLRVHKSQGMGFIIDRLLSGRPKAYYDLEQESVSEGREMDDEFGVLFKGISRPDSRYAPQLLDSGATRQEALNLLLTDESWQSLLSQRSTDGSQQLILSATDAEARLLISDNVVVPGQEIEAALLFADLGQPNDLGSAKAMLYGVDDAEQIGLVVVSDTSADDRTTITIPESWEITLPERRNFRERPDQGIGAWATISLPTDNDMLEQFHVIEQVEVAPPVLPEFLAGPYLLRDDHDTTATIPVKLTNYTPGAHTQTVSFSVPEGWKVEPASVDMAFAKEDETRVITVTVTAPRRVEPGHYAITATTDQLDFTPEASIAVIDFEPPAGDPLIGLIDSYDVQFRNAMDKMGVRWESITEKDYSAERLDAFDLILVDMRSYLYRPDLEANNAAVLDYVKRGGTMIVNYHKTFDWYRELAPYPLALSRNRVTREDAPVKQLVPDHPVWNVPNTIGAADWEGWRQERGLYFAGTWDDAYTPLLEMSDPGETITPGSMLIADYGEGKYLYTALVWYRQLRELNPGAVRIFANMLSL